MIYKFRGETVRFNTVIKDMNGTALNSETPVLHFEDATGSNLFNGTGTFTSSGSYYVQTQLGAAWGTGAARYWWTVYGANGSAQEVRTNELCVLGGNAELPSYVYEAELPNYYLRITDYIDERTPYKLHERYNYINRLLESKNIKAPRKKNADDGQYDASLRAMNAWFAIYDMVAEDQVNRVPNDEEPWYNKFWLEGTKIWSDIDKNRIVFSDQVSPAESGITEPVRTAGSSIGTLRNNWDNSYGDGFTGDDFERKWLFQVIGTSTDLGTALVKWSMDNGISYGTMTSGYDWTELDDGVWVRFDIGTATGTAGILANGDAWSFTTMPRRRALQGNNVARCY